MKFRPTVKLWKHQRVGLRRLWQMGSALLWWDTGTGKTRAAVSYALARRAQGVVQRVLVVCPLAAVGVWANEFRLQLPGDSSIGVITRNDVQRVADLPRLAERIKWLDLAVAVITYEVLVRQGKYWADEWRPDLLIVDESQKIKAYSAKRTRRVLAVARSAPYRLCLSGTPAPNGYIDLYWQIKVVAPEALPSTLAAFRDRYCVMGGYFDKEIVGYKNVDELGRALAPHVLRVRADALSLPPVLDQVVPLRLGPTAQRLYAQLRRDFVAQVGDAQVLAPNQLVLLTRLLQLTGGHLADQMVDTTKLDALLDLIEAEGGNKVVVFAHYLPELAAIRQVLTKAGVSCETLTGQVSGPKRDDLVRRFQEEDKPQVLAVQIQAGGLAITLHRAAVAIFYSLDYNAEMYQQARGRIHRGGQTRTCRYLHLLAQDTVDEEVYAAVRGKMSRQDALARLVQRLRKEERG